ncbi:uncharacterized protein RAG0_04100 [Rhynchosporium agropyri]|uniref:Uncharacterized protein n=1 Tax=Rhynchosporium agropyri TaxID=914238 RepID=A0A1E1K7L3_9HELO|nr:uncharacterized protein RAG0_04100 [Rhynchosporium agropyri]
MADDRYIEAKRTIRPIIGQRTRASSVPATSSRQPADNDGMHQSIYSTLCLALRHPSPPSRHAAYLDPQANNSKAVIQPANSIKWAGFKSKHVPRDSLKHTEPAIFKKSVRTVRANKMSARHGRLELELSEMMDGVSLTGYCMGDTSKRSSEDGEERESRKELRDGMDLDDGKKEDDEGDIDMEWLKIGA